MITFRHAPLLFLLCAFLAPTLRAEDAKDVFNTLYSALLKHVAATADKADDLSLAKGMLGVAKTSGQTPELLALLCESTYDLASKQPEGFATAAEAMTLLAESVESKRASAREKLIDVLTKQSRIGKAEDRDAAGEKVIELYLTIGDEKAAAKKSGEAIGDYRRALTLATQKKSPLAERAKERLDEATRMDRVEKDVARLQERLLRDANDAAAAQELTRLFLFELDDAAEAMKILDRVKDEPLKAAVMAWDKPVDEVTEAQCLSLGEWHRAAARELKGPAARTALERASHYLGRYVAAHGTSDLPGKKAEVLLKEVQADLAKQPASARTVATSFPVNPADWAVKCWNGKRWEPLPLSKMETSATKDGLTAKNSTRISDHAHLYLKTPLDGDFDCELVVQGVWRQVGLNPTDGADKGFGANPPPGGDERTERKVRVRRKGDKLEFFIDGKPVKYFNHKNAATDMASHLHFGIDNDQTIRVVRFTLKGNEPIPK